MDLHSRKLTRRSLLRGIGAGALVAVAAPILFPGGVAFAAGNQPRNWGPNHNNNRNNRSAWNTQQTWNQNTNDRSGTVIFKPKGNLTAAQVLANPAYAGCKVVMTFTGSNQALVWSPRVLYTLF